MSNTAEDLTPRASATFLTWSADAAQAAEMCRATCAGMSARPAAFEIEHWHVLQAFARLFERLVISFDAWPKKTQMTFEEKSADIRALHNLKEAAAAMIEARRLK